MVQTESGSQYWPAPAKLNLFLHITGRGADGYHRLQTLFQLLDWGDHLRIGVTADGQIQRTCVVAGIDESEDICLRAARLLQTRCNVQRGARIELTKRIPVGAGLGGGSSDAATVLLVLNKLWGCGLSKQELAAAGLELGADVPVFVNGYSALACGRGEILQATTLGKRYYVLVLPSFGISTAEVFRHPQLIRDSRLLDKASLRLEPGRNDCQPAVLQMFPEMNEMMLDLAAFAQPHMSGTGSTIFLPFASKKSAISAATELKCRYNVRVVGGVDQSPLLDRLSEVR